MTLLKRIKDYYDGKRNHYHLERAVPEPTEETPKGEYDDETLAEILGAEATLPKDITDKLIEKPYKE